VHDSGRLASTFGIIDDELQRSVSDEIRQSGGGATLRRTTWRGRQWCGGKLGRRLGFCYLRIKIQHGTGTIYRAFGTYS
jgi:hypothetical protein